MVTRKNILLVEDEPTLQRILGSVLGDAGHRVITAGTAEQAQEILDGGPLDDGGEVDLVLTDKNLPRQSGLELLASVRHGERNGRRLIAVMLVTGYPSRDSALQALRDDADGYLVKPFRSLSSAVELIQSVLDADLVERRRAPPLARRVGNALMGLPEDLAGVDVGSFDVAIDRAVADAGGRVVDVNVARVVVGTDLAALVRVGRARPGTGLVFVEAGATFQDVVEFVGVGGGALVDRSIVEGNA